MVPLPRHFLPAFDKPQQTILNFGVTRQIQMTKVRIRVSQSCSPLDILLREKSLAAGWAAVLPDRQVDGALVMPQRPEVGEMLETMLAEVAIEFAALALAGSHRSSAVLTLWYTVNIL